MARFYDGWPPYVSVAERRKQAEREVAKLRKKGRSINPVLIEGRTIATTFWGKSWCKNLEGYRDFENRLPRGRSYVRNGSVIDLQISPSAIQGLVSGSDIYQVSVKIKALPKTHWRAICESCSGSIDSLVELLRGTFSKGVMERLCRRDQGLFPRPSEITFSCSCPDSASMCKHVAAVLYGVGWRLDKEPELLFRLRAVDEKDLVSSVAATAPLARKTPAATKLLQEDDVAALFGVDMEASETSFEENDVNNHTKRGKVKRAKNSRTATRKTSKATDKKKTARRKTVSKAKGRRKKS